MSCGAMEAKECLQTTPVFMMLPFDVILCCISMSLRLSDRLLLDDRPFFPCNMSKSFGDSELKVANLWMCRLNSVSRSKLSRKREGVEVYTYMPLSLWWTQLDVDIVRGDVAYLPI